MDDQQDWGAVGARYRRIFDTCRPFLVASHLGAAAAATAPPSTLGAGALWRVNPHRTASAEFLRLLHRLDELTYGPVAMPMPGWVFYDCAASPGGIFGFARAAADVPGWVRRTLDVPVGYTGPVPLSMFVLIPMLQPGAWHSYTLCSVNEVAPGAAPAGLRSLTEAVGLSVLGVELAYGATQWRSHKMDALGRFAPLELLTAWTPAHSDPATFTYRFRAEGAHLVDALMGRLYSVPEAELIWVDCDERRDLLALQSALEAGRRFELVGRPHVEGSFVRAPLRELSAGKRTT